ncbi:uncharacterized protein LOC143285995 isoform X2 [Babylonia areolata]|uniref:uncharacterized protein LOC143285995 isoform X2 n=1 Tax=Babylonia areolata TaxID=304850 RepID=UPI003FCF32E2
MKRQLLWEFFALGLVLMGVARSVESTGVQNVNVTLSRVSTLYLPMYAANGSLVYTYPSYTVEKLAVDFSAKVIYGAGFGVLHVINASDVANLTSLKHVRMTELELTDVKICGGAVFVSYRNDSNKLRGGVRVYKPYDEQLGGMTLVHDIPMGSLPDMINPTPNCTLVVAVENEGFVQGGQFYDLPGGVGIIRFPSGIEAEPEVKILDFTKFDDQYEQLSASGVRWVYRGSGNNFSNNVEPEYVTFNHDYTTAFVCLQENNAIAVVDLRTDSITAIRGLGFKPWRGLQLDPSDRDGGIHMSSWPVYGMYQPDTIDWVHWDGEDYLLTANEGDSQEYPAPALFSEEIRGKDIPDSDIADSVSAELRQALRNSSALGRLVLSNVDGRNSEGKLERFMTYGSRSFSVWRTLDMAQVFDSGSQIAEEHAQWRPDLFNCFSSGADLLADAMDTRSDNKGPETESMSVGVLEGHLLIFVGNERPGTLAVYSVAPGGFEPRFQTLFTEGIPRDSRRTLHEMFEARELYSVDPENIEFIPTSAGLADFPLLLLGGSVSGTVSVLRVNVQPVSDVPGPSTPGPACPGPSSVASSLTRPAGVVVILCWLLTLTGVCGVYILQGSLPRLYKLPPRAEQVNDDSSQQKLRC